MHWSFLVLVVLYAGFILALAAQWASISHANRTNNELPNITIVVAFRNEIIHLPSLLDSLLVLEYPQDKLEILLVDDHSEDQPSDYLKSYLTYDHIQLLHSEGNGKKAAISFGVSKAKGDWIVVTDADCTVQKSWLEGLSQYMSGDTHFLFGPVRIVGSGLLQGFQRIEQAALTALGAVAIRKGTPSMANAANMGFRRVTFQSLGGFSGNSDMPTGDDEFLLKKIHAAYPEGVVYVKQREVIVDTAPSDTLKIFLHQRIRWASKWGRQAQPLFAVFIAVFYVLMISKTTQVIIQKEYMNLALWGIKWLADLVLVVSVQLFLKQPINALIFLIGQILYPIYSILIAILANFGSYSWKGRTYKTR